MNPAARLACAAVAIIAASAAGPFYGFLAAVVAGCWLIITWRTAHTDPPPGNGEALKALERIATKAVTSKRGGRRRH